MWFRQVDLTSWQGRARHGVVALPATYSLACCMALHVPHKLFCSRLLRSPAMARPSLPHVARPFKGHGWRTEHGCLAHAQSSVCFIRCACHRSGLRGRATSVAYVSTYVGVSGIFVAYASVEKHHSTTGMQGILYVQAAVVCVMPSPPLRCTVALPLYIFTVTSTCTSASLCFSPSLSHTHVRVCVYVCILAQKRVLVLSFTMHVCVHACACVRACVRMGVGVGCSLCMLLYSSWHRYVDPKQLDFPWLLGTSPGCGNVLRLPKGPPEHVCGHGGLQQRW